MITRLFSGTALTSAFNSVVFPACVEPLTKIFRPDSTHLMRKAQTSSDITPRFDSSVSDLPLIKCFRMFTAQNCAVISGIATCNLLPSGRRASTKGCERSNLRPPHMSNLSTRFRTSSKVNVRFVSSLIPLRAIKIRLGEFIQTSSISGSSISS